MELYDRGSEWRKWDFHIHTPETKKNDQYSLPEGDVWDEYCKKIEESDVAAFGITDYFSADGYSTFVEKFKDKYPESQKLFFPNVELCTNDVVNTAGEEVNLHIIFNPKFAEIDTKIEEFLKSLKTNKTNTGGRNIKASELSTPNDYQEATTTREFIEEALEGTFGDKVDLTEILLIFTPVNNDGLRTATEVVGGKVRGKKRKVIITDELDKFSHGFFGNSNNTAYFLNKYRLESDEETDQKPVITGSDAHSFSDIGEWLGKVVLREGEILKQSTWIKADLTFEGLRQVIFEPEYRVYIGEEPEIETQVRTDPRRYLESVYIDQLKGYDGHCGVWFKDEKIPLNKELIAIIGNKGSGKSALTDIVGLIGNSHNQKYKHSNGKSQELFSFLNKDKFLKSSCASNFSATLNWHAGNPDSKLLDSETDISIEEKVEYLPQKYLEKICSNIEDDEFRQKLNEVIFEYVEKKDRYGMDNLEALIEYLANQTEEDIQTAKETLHAENESVVTIEKKLSQDHRREIAEKIRLKNEEIEAHKKNRPAIINKPPEGGQTATNTAAEITKLETDASSLSDQIKNLRTEQTKISTQVENLKQLRQAVERQRDSLTVLYTKYKVTLDTVGMKLGDVISISVDYIKLDEIAAQKKTRLVAIAVSLRTESEIGVMALEPNEIEDALKQSLVCQHAQLEVQKKKIVNQLDKPAREYQKYLKTKYAWDLREKTLVGDEENPVENTLNWIKEEEKKIMDTYPGELHLARESRAAASMIIFEKKQGLVTFYETVKTSIDEEIKKYGEELGEYDISIESSLRFNSTFCEDFFRFINQAVKGSFYGINEGKAMLLNVINAVDNWEDEDQVSSAIQIIIDHIDADKRDDLSGNEEKAKDIFRQLKQSKNPVDFYDFLFGFEYLETKYDLEVDEKDLSELSPGERGGVLLIFYLMLDRRTIPLVIDQPEDNLDNKSVYEILVTFLKKAKKRRQIIIATHNPNLAVVADAEQIIHVSIDKKMKNDFDFYSGSIENPKINKEVVNILEGTLPAFDNRRLKYRKQKKS